MTAVEVIKILKEDGWYELPGKKTGHKQFKHYAKPGKVTVSMHKGDIPLDTLRSMEKQSGLKLR